MIDLESLKLSLPSFQKSLTEALPNELIAHILDYLPLTSFGIAARSCQFFANHWNHKDWKGEVKKTHLLAYHILCPLFDEKTTWKGIYQKLLKTPLIWSTSQELQTYNSVIRHLTSLPNRSLVGAGDPIEQENIEPVYWSKLYSWPLKHDLLNITPIVRSGNNEGITGITSLGNSHVVSAQECTVNLWMTDDNFYLIKTYDHPVCALQSINNNQVIIATQDGNFHLLSVKEKTSILLSKTPHENATNFIVICGENRFATASRYDNFIYLWNLHDCSAPQKVFQNSTSINYLTFLAPGVLAVGSNEGQLSLWSLSSEKETCLKVSESEITCLTSITNSHLAIGFNNGSIQIIHPFDPNQQKFILKEHTGAIESLACQEDGTLVASGSCGKTISWPTPFDSWIRQIVKKRKPSLNFIK